VRLGTGKQLFGPNEQDGGYDCVEELQKSRTQAKSRVSEIGAWAVTKKEKYWEESRLSAEAQEREMEKATLHVVDAVVDIAEILMRLRSQWPVPNDDEIGVAVEEAGDFLRGLGEAVKDWGQLKAGAQLIERRRQAEEYALKEDN
jgi:hypothetical protein